MPHFKVTHPWSGFEGIFEAEDPISARDAMARAMGYHDYNHACMQWRRGEFELLIERMNDEKADDMKTIHDLISCEDILARLSEGDLEDLEAWRYLENIDSAHLGGRGRTDSQMDAADRAWDALSPNAQNAFLDMRRSVVDDLIAAMREVGIPETDRDIDAITALLGHDHPSFRIMPAYALVDAYAEAMEAKDQIEA